MSLFFEDSSSFITTIEVVPPTGNDPDSLLEKLNALSHLDFQAFSVAYNPVAKPKMSALVFTHLIQKTCQKKAILHLTVRDHNRLGLQSELWGAKALGIETVIAVSGDPSAPEADQRTSTVCDLNVFDLVSMIRDSDLGAGAVFDFRPEVDGMAHETERLKRKVGAGAEFIVTQPIYDEQTAQQIYAATNDLNVPVIMGILPLLSPRHANFLHDKVAGIAVPEYVRKEMADSKDPVETGIIQSRQMLELARNMFSGACVMPPFERFEILEQIL